MIEKKEVKYKDFGRCLKICNSLVKLIVTLDFGPRIICYSFLDGENIMFEDGEKVFSQLSPEMEQIYGKGRAWKIYGGHRIWTAPEDMLRTYYPDNDEVSYKLTENGAVFIPPVQKHNNYGYSLSIELAENTTEVKIRHGVTNNGTDSMKFAIWPITALSPGGVEVVPQPTQKTGCAPKMHLAFWDYVKMTDKRLTWLDKYIILKQDPEYAERIKFGINSEHGFAMYFNHGDLFIKKFNVNPCGNYPDGGMSFETFTNQMFLEMESLGELRCVLPGETVLHTESWSLYKENLPVLTDVEIDKLKEKYITVHRKV